MYHCDIYEVGKKSERFIHFPHTTCVCGSLPWYFYWGKHKLVTLTMLVLMLIGTDSVLQFTYIYKNEKKFILHKSYMKKKMISLPRFCKW